jgi:hypothetical protein
MTRRAIELEGTDTVLELSKATAIKTDKNMIHLDQLPDGTWRLIYNGNLIPDFTKVKSLKILREDDNMDFSYCPCCGAERINGVGECYTDCMFYEGDEPPDANPH